MYRFIDFTGKKIIVAGASSGIGKQTAITLSRLGAQVILLARREEKLKDAEKELDGENHGYYCADLSKTEQTEVLIKKIVEEYGRIDGLVYAAGISIDTPLHLMKKEKTEQVFETNFFGFVECVKQVCKKGRFNDGLRIVGISSVSSFFGNKAHEAYAASKAAMNAFVRCVAVEQAGKGISINNVAPGWTETEMTEVFANQGGMDGEEFKRSMERQYKGVIQPEDVANAVVFLLSPASKMITGITLAVDGGATTN